MSAGVAATVYTARAAALLYAAAIALLLMGREHDVRARIAWTLGCALIWVHVALAFGVVHHWSHGEAYRFTAEQSRRLTGMNAGAGIYLNYLFMLVWAGDCAFWWMAGCDAYRRRRRPIAFAVHGFLLFIAINATVVFAAGATRFVAATVCAALLLLLARRRQISDAGA